MFWVALLAGEGLGALLVGILVAPALARRARSASRRASLLDARVHHLLRSERAAALTVDRGGVITWYQGARVPGTSIARGSALGRPMAEVLAPWPEWVAAVRAANRGEAGTVTSETGGSDDSGDAGDGPTIEVHCSPRLDDRDRPIEVLVSFRDVSAAAEDRRRVDELARARSRVLGFRVRSQINVVLSVLQLRTAEGEQSTDADTALASDAALRLLTYVDQFADYLRMESDEEASEPQPFSLRALAEDVAEEHRALAESTRGTLVVRHPPSAADEFEGDPRRLRQMLVLLSGVALRTNPGRRVIVNVAVQSATTESALVEVSVEDSGDGLSREARERIFQAFESESAMWARRSGATGLELPLARAIAMRLGGTLQVRSVPGSGTSFALRLQLQRTALLDAQPPGAGPNRPETTPALRVLVVDDDQTQRGVVARMLGALGHHAVTVPLGTHALRLLDAEPFDCVLTEMHLPEITGPELAAAIRERTGAGAAPAILVLTADASEAARAEAARARMPLVLKPFTRESLGAALAATARVRLLSAPRPAGPPSLDASALRRLRAADAADGPRVVRELVDAFLAVLPRELILVRDAVANGDEAAAATVIPRVRTSARLLGARRLERVLTSLADAIRDDDSRRASDLSAALSAESALVRDELRDLLREGEPAAA